MTKKLKYFMLATIMTSAIGLTIKSLADTGSAIKPLAPALSILPANGKMPSLSKASGWLNSQSLSPADLKGKVVLINFCTYSCINWIRSLPYVRAWAAKYKNNGLVVIGVHTPEFSFEKNIDNVRRALKNMSIDYPIAIDNSYSIWHQFGNQYWPALYFVDARGRIRHQQFGEGEYDVSERMIQKLLAETGVGGVSNELVSVDATGAEAAPDWGNLKSPENYVGFERTQNFASPEGGVMDKTQVYTAPAALKLNQWAISGNWIFGRETVVLTKAKGRIIYRFRARDLHLVMGAAARGTSLRFQVLIDGQPPASAHGTDIDEQGYGTVREQRLYQLIRQSKPIVERQFQIEFLDPGVEVFSFTFG